MFAGYSGWSADVECEGCDCPIAEDVDTKGMPISLPCEDCGAHLVVFHLKCAPEWAQQEHRRLMSAWN